MHEYGKRWLKFHQAWLRQKSIKVHLLQYKNLQENLWSEMLALGAFLGVDEQALANNTHMACVVNSSHSKPLKRKTHIFAKSPFTESMNSTLNNYTESVQKLAMRYFGITLNL